MGFSVSYPIARSPLGTKNYVFTFAQRPNKYKSNIRTAITKDVFWHVYYDDDVCVCVLQSFANCSDGCVAVQILLHLRMAVRDRKLSTLLAILSYTHKTANANYVKKLQLYDVYIVPRFENID